MPENPVLLNALAGYERVVVTDIPGTTRDISSRKKSAWAG